MPTHIKQGCLKIQGPRSLTCICVQHFKDRLNFCEEQIYRLPPWQVGLYGKQGSFLILCELHFSDQEGDEDGYNYKDMVRRDERRWKRADTDGDSKLTKDEFTHFLHPEEAEHMRDIVIDVSCNRAGDLLGMVAGTLDMFLEIVLSLNWPF